ncbi:arginine repressor [uncultured Enterococcus sp.]|uniref:arginine repressor n=1 Tax=uncultured Enterococcus sp. TaxID=167972 RepID=UPI0025FF679E|nr:arginine repressor [uncultured Enterococcus sp.]
MRKKDRHQLLTRLLSEQDIAKQEEFVAILEQRGIQVTQATISRDIKELKLIKVPAATGGYRYSLPAQNDVEVAQRMENLLKHAVRSVDKMDKFVLINTMPGNARALANLLESYYTKELFGMMTDDDTILMITKTHEARDVIYEEIRRYEQ